jgi:hypothetical protein
MYDVLCSSFRRELLFLFSSEKECQQNAYYLLQRLMSCVRLS